MGCPKISYHQRETALNESWEIFVNGQEKNASGEKNSKDYYTFGSPMRTYSAASYRYGFNGAEKIDEVSGSGNHYDLGLRNYDTRIARMWKIDPRTKEYPWQSPYAYHRNNPIAIVDYLGGGDGPDKKGWKPLLDIKKWWEIKRRHRFRGLDFKKHTDKLHKEDFKNGTLRFFFIKLTSDPKTLLGKPTKEFNYDKLIRKVGRQYERLLEKHEWYRYRGFDDRAVEDTRNNKEFFKIRMAKVKTVDKAVIFIQYGRKSYRKYKRERRTAYKKDIKTQSVERTIGRKSKKKGLPLY